MVKAGDIGKASKDFLKKDFFSHNEVKVTQAGCCASKNTTTFKLGDAVKADHKIEMKSCPLTKVPAKVTLGSTTATDVEWTFKQGAASNKLTASTNLASILDVNNLKLKNEFDFAKDVSGINTHLNMNTTTKGTNFLQPINFGFGLEKSGYQFGVTGTVNDITAPAVSKNVFTVGWAGCSNFNVCASTTTGSDWVLNGLLKKDGRTYAVDLDCNNWGANLATNIPNGKTVRWVDWSTADPLEKVREFEIDPNERGGLRPAERQVCQPKLISLSIFNFVKFIISRLGSFLARSCVKYDALVNKRGVIFQMTGQSRATKNFETLFRHTSGVVTLTILFLTIWWRYDATWKRRNLCAAN